MARWLSGWRRSATGNTAENAERPTSNSAELKYRTEGNKGERRLTRNLVYFVIFC
jgi:hypothetical protein